METVNSWLYFHIDKVRPLLGEQQEDK